MVVQLEIGVGVDFEGREDRNGKVNL